MKYCEFCRKELADNEKCTCEGAVANRKEKSETKKKVLFGSIGIILIAIITVVIIAIGTASVKIDPFLYTDVSFEGYSSNGTVIVDFDEDSLICDIIGEEPDSFEGLIEWSDKYDMYAEGISYTFKPSEGLSNGDVVTVTFSITGTAQNKIKSVTKEFTVEGLTEIELVDVFKDVELVFSGIDGDGTVRINNTSSDPFISKVDFRIDKDTGVGSSFNLSNGDVISIVAQVDDDLIQQYNKGVAQTTKTFTVSGLGKSISASDLTKDFIEQVKQVAYNVLLKTEEKESYKYDYSNIKYECTYFYDNENRHDYYTSDRPKTELVVFYSLDLTDLREDDSEKKVYCGVSFSSASGQMILNPDGTYKMVIRGTEYEFDIDMGRKEGWEDTLEEAVLNIHPVFEDKSYYTRTKVDACLCEYEEDYIVEKLDDIDVEPLPQKIIETELSSHVETNPPAPVVTEPPAPVATEPVVTTPSEPTPVVTQMADLTTGISWDGVSSIIYTYPDGTTGTEIQVGATYEALPGRINTVDESHMPNWKPDSNEYDGHCTHCGKKGGDGSNGTCLRYWTGGDHTCANCGVIVPQSTCHTCNN